MMHFFKKCLAILALVVSVSQVHAYDFTTGTMELGGFAGYTWLDDFAGQIPKDHLLYGARFGVFFTPDVSLETSYQFTKSETRRAVPPQSDANFQHLRFNLLFHMLPGKKFNPFLTGGLGWIRADFPGAYTANDLSINGGLGAHIFLTNSLALRVDGRYVYTEVQDKRNHNIEAALGVSYFFGPQAKRDADKDGVTDKADQCPATQSGAKVDARGCPTDTDLDGIYDGIDQCENTVAGAKVDSKGCPTDGDGDGVVDGLDQCPETPKDTKVNEKGCTLVLDADSDGVEDAKDECPETPKGVEVTEKGCPKDTDADGVLDYIDLCSNTAPGTKVDDKGCPIVTKSRGVLKGVNFKTNSAILLPQSLPILDEVAKELAQFENVKVEVQGHTDSIGDPKKNADLSQKRAEAVAAYLVSKGIAKERLVSKGYGKDVPIGSNKTKAGRAQNRRVELKWQD